MGFCLGPVLWCLAWVQVLASPLILLDPSGAPFTALSLPFLICRMCDMRPCLGGLGEVRMEDVLTFLEDPIPRLGLTPCPSPPIGALG